jgi:glucosamine--fructose-6-phosphate aminotransferase (isomerizing)
MPLEPVARSFRHAMLREIYEQPAAIARTIEHYLDLSGDMPAFRDEPLAKVAALFRKHPDLIIAASGSSRHAGLAAEILLEDLAGLVVDVEYASEYACRSTHLRRHPEAPSPVLVLSQSGETADTLAALREANRRGHPTIAVTNVAGSTMMHEASVALCTQAGSDEELYDAAYVDAHSGSAGGEGAWCACGCRDCRAAGGAGNNAGGD